MVFVRHALETSKGNINASFVVQFHDTVFIKPKRSIMGNAIGNRRMAPASVELPLR